MILNLEKFSLKRDAVETVNCKISVGEREAELYRHENVTPAGLMEPAAYRMCLLPQMNWHSVVSCRIYLQFSRLPGGLTFLIIVKCPLSLATFLGGG